jgi:hypothetical protein
MRPHSVLAIMILAAGLLVAARLHAQPQQRSPAAAVRAVLYEEDPTDPLGKRYAGSAVWRIVSVPPASGGTVDPAIRADVEVPERGIAVTVSLRRDPEQTVRASHRFEVMFRLSPGFASGGIQSVPGLLMKLNEQARGVPLAGRAMKRDATSFEVDLSAKEDDKERNLRLLRERGWFDVPIIFTNGRRAILAFEKGAAGEEAFDAVLAAWGQ